MDRNALSHLACRTTPGLYLAAIFIVHGAVTDFLVVWLRPLPWQIFNPWPTFNVADSAISIGAILIILDTFFARSQQKN